MSLIDTIIGRQNLQQLPPEQQEQARSEATRQFWLNTLLSGRGLAGGFAATQQVIPSIRAAQQEREMSQAIQKSMVPQGTGLTQFGAGSQADMLAQENMMFGNDPVVADRTREALERNSNLPKQIDPNLYLQNVLPLVAKDPSKALPIIEAAVPKLDSTLGIARDLSGNVTQTFELEGKVPGTGVRRGAGGELTTRALPGAAMAAAEARPPEFPQGTVVGGIQIQDFPIYQNGQLVGYTRREVPMATEVPGVSQIIQNRQINQATAETFGQETEVWDPVQRRMVRVSRAQALGYNRPPAGQRQPVQGQPGQPAQPQGQQGGAGVGGFATGPNVNEQILTEASGKAFVKKVEENQAKASTAGTRRFQAERTYDTVSRLDPTVLTAFGSTVVPFLRVIPGMKDATEQFAVDTSLIKQQWAGGVLGNFGLAKGNLNEKEVNLVEKANWDQFGPRTATRYVVTIEAALAAKDDARNKFTEEFIANGGDFRLFESQWSKSPMNQPIWNDPMMDRFIRDEVTEALSRRQPNQDPKFNLPPGFRVIGGVERNGVLQGVQVEKPDGSLFIVR
jgi:hypothetical protein